MIEITARQIGGLIHLVADYIEVLEDLKTIDGMHLTIETELNLVNAKILMKQINDAQSKRIMK